MKERKNISRKKLFGTAFVSGLIGAGLGAFGYKKYLEQLENIHKVETSENNISDVEDDDFFEDEDDRIEPEDSSSSEKQSTTNNVGDKEVDKVDENDEVLNLMTALHQLVDDKLASDENRDAIFKHLKDAEKQVHLESELINYKTLISRLIIGVNADSTTDELVEFISDFQIKKVA